MAEGGGIWTPGGEYRPQREEDPSPPESAREITPEELTEMMRQLKVAEFLLSNMSTLAQLAYAKLDRSSRDLGDARLAIDALRAQLPVLEGTVPEQVLRDFGQVVTNLQLAFVGAVDEEDPNHVPEPEPEGPDREPGAAEEPDAGS